MNISLLTKASQPYFHWTISSGSDAFDAVRGFESVAPTMLARIIRGSRCTTKADLMNELAAALQFPPHFGENWDALNDCLCDPHWLSGSGVMIGILDANRVLERGETDELSTFVSVLEAAGDHWTGGRKPHSFHVVLHATEEEASEAAKRWEAAGAKTKPTRKKKS